MRFVDPFGYQGQDPQDSLDRVIININDAEQQRRLKQAEEALGPIGSLNPFDQPTMPSKLCTAGICGGQTVRGALTDAARAVDRKIGDIKHSIKLAIPDGLQLNVQALFVISADVTITPDFDVFGGIDIPILSGWTEAIGAAASGRELTPKSGFGVSLTGIYIFDPNVRDLSSEARLGESGAQDSRRSYLNGTDYTVSGCYYLC